MYSVCENLGQTQQIDIGKDSGKQIFYYLSHLSLSFTSVHFYYAVSHLSRFPRG